MHLLSVLAFATLASSCARPLIYACGYRSRSEPALATVDVRAWADRGYALEIVHMDVHRPLTAART